MPFLGIFLAEARLPSASTPACLEVLSCTALSMPMSTHTAQSLPKVRGIVAGWLEGTLFSMPEIILDITNNDAVLSEN